MVTRANTSKEWEKSIFDGMCNWKEGGGFIAKFHDFKPSDFSTRNIVLFSAWSALDELEVQLMRVPASSYLPL